MKYKTNKTYKTQKELDPDFDPSESQAEILGFFKHVKQQTTIVVPIDESIKGPNYYRSVVQAIAELNEEDTVEFNINSPGGRLDGLISILSALEMSPCHSIANLSGSVCSAASMLALHCNEIKVSPYSTMMIHNISFGSTGKVSDIVGHVQHVRQTSDQLMRDTYHNFLTEDEINEVLKGQELWFNADEVVQRFTDRFELEAALLEELQEASKESLGDLSELLDEVEPEVQDTGEIVVKRKKK